MATATLKDCADFFRTGVKDTYSLAAFTADWKALTDTDREQIREGIGNGTFNY